MKTLSLAPYDISAPPTEVDGVITVGRTQPYPIKDALVNILFAQTGLRARDLLRRDDVARKILAAEGPDLLLEDAEFEQLKSAVDTLEGFGRHDVELVRRVLTAE